MYIENFITKRFIITVTIGALVAVVLGWLVASYFNTPDITTNTSTRTTQELSEALSQYDSSLPSGYQLGDSFKITNVTHSHTWWYLVDISYNSGDKESAFTTQAVLADFANTASSLKVVLGPNQSLPGRNTSTLNIPYDIIESVSKTQGVKL